MGSCPNLSNGAEVADTFDNCGDCFYSTGSPATHGYTAVAPVTLNGWTSDLNWYQSFILFADLRLFQPSGVSGCGGYRSGDTSLWKITAYQATSSSPIRLRWYFKDCCYQEETMPITGTALGGGNSLSGYTTCINNKTSETGVSATIGADKIFTKLRLEDYGVEYNITSSDVQVYNQRCRKVNQSTTISVDSFSLFVDTADGSPEECEHHSGDCPQCTSDNEFSPSCSTDYAQIVTITDAENWDTCVGGTTFVNWQCQDSGIGLTPCSGDPCDCYMEDVEITVAKI